MNNSKDHSIQNIKNFYKENKTLFQLRFCMWLCLQRSDDTVPCMCGTLLATFVLST